MNHLHFFDVWNNQTLSRASFLLLWSCLSAIIITAPMLTSNNSSNRTLMRTEQTIDKIMAVFPYSHVKKVKKYLHQELRASNLRDKILSQASSLQPSHRINCKQQSYKIHQRSARSLFSNAHKASKDQSYITIVRQKSQNHRVKNHRLMIRNTVSEKLMTTINQTETDGSTSPNLTLEGHKQHQTIAYVQNQRKYRRKSSFKRSGSSEPVKDEVQNYIDTKGNELSRINISKLQTLQEAITTKDRSGKQQINWVLKTQKESKEQKSINQPQSIEIQEKKSKKEDRDRQQKHASHPLKTVTKIPSIGVSQGFKQDVATNVSKKLFQQSLERNKPATTTRQKLYHEANNIDFLDIEQIRFQESQPSTQKYSLTNLKEAHHTKSTTHQPIPTEKQISYALSTIEEVFPQQQPKHPQHPITQQQLRQKKHPKAKFSKKDVKLSTIDSSIPQDLNQQLCFVEKVTLVKEFNSSSIQVKHLNITKRNEPVDNSSKQLNAQLQCTDKKLKVGEVVKKLGLLKAELQMLAELATFFSQNSKAFKINKTSEEFLRNNSDLKWHKLIYLCFRFFYIFLIFVEQYYSWASSVISIKKDEFQIFRAENLQLRDTLFKIQKSVRKNTPILSQDQVWLSNPMPKVSDEDLPGLIEDLTIRKTGKIILGSQLDELHDRITSQATVVIKSIFLSKVLGSQAKVALIIKQGVFRILNACIILNLFRKYGYSRRQNNVEPIVDISKLSNPSVQLFKRFYNFAVEHIFEKA